MIPITIIPPASMPWKCIACKTKFQGPTDRTPKRGCPHCGSTQIFDCNVTPITIPALPSNKYRVITLGSKALTHNPLKFHPPAFRSYLAKLVMSERHTSLKRLHRFLILRLQLWRDGITENAIPGYQTPPPDGPKGYPLGWSISSLRKSLHHLSLQQSPIGKSSNAAH